MAGVKKRQKYDLGAAVDKELVFDFPFLLNDETVSYLQEHGKVMFILRGPPSTGKATLSEMIQDKYPDAVFCCADQYFQNSFESPIRNKATLQASHAYCKKKATSACKNKVPTILVQNTHMKKWEMQPYLDLAASYNYTVIMAITLYRFNVTPEALLNNSTDGLDIQYFRRRLAQWEDNPPYVTGWFLGPSDSLYLQNAALESVQKLTDDGKFCRVFDIYDADQIAKEFQVKNILCCIAGHSTKHFSMKKYYLSPDVQDVYGKCFAITILGYHVTSSYVNAIVKVDDEMKPLLFEDTKKGPYDLSDQMSDLELGGNLLAFGQTSKFVQKSADNYTAYTEDWKDDEDIDTVQCSFICLAQRKDPDALEKNANYNIDTIREEFKKSLNSAGDSYKKINSSSYTELESNIKICRLEGNEWIIKADKKIIIKTVFTGFYP